MIKAVFMDYTGTIVQEGGRHIQELVMYLCSNSELRDPAEVVARWWSLVKQYEQSSYLDSYITEEEIVDRILQTLKKEIKLRGDWGKMREMIRGFWVYAPIFPDVREFFEKCPAPIYVISNNGIQYVEKAMEDKQLSPAGIVCADMVRAYKPHRELFEKALEISGCAAAEVIHIGDSYASDVQGAVSAGIRPILIDRSGKQRYDGITVIREMSEALAQL